MKQTFVYLLLLSLVAGCAVVPVVRLSGTGSEWWDTHKNRKVF